MGAPVQKKPWDVAEGYKHFDIPVDIAAGRQDMIIESDSVHLHYHHLKACGVETSFKEFDFGHLDFTFSAAQDLHHYVLDHLETWPLRQR